MLVYYTPPVTLFFLLFPASRCAPRQQAGQELVYSDNRAANSCRAFTDPHREMGPWYPGEDEKEEELRVGYSQAGLASQLQGGCLARQQDGGGAQRWYPSEADTGGGPGSDGEGSVVSLSVMAYL